MTCTAMCGSGVRIGMVIILKVLLQIRLALKLAQAVFCVAVHGTGMSQLADLQIVLDVYPMIGMRLSDSVLLLRSAAKSPRNRWMALNDRQGAVNVKRKPFRFVHIELTALSASYTRQGHNL